MPQESKKSGDDEGGEPCERPVAQAVVAASSGASAVVAEPKAVSEVKKTAAVLDSTSDSGHASDGTDHLESNAAAGAAVITDKNGRVRL